MDTFWIITYMIIAGMIIVLIPFSMFFYETDEEDTLVYRSLKFLLWLSKYKLFFFWFIKFKRITTALCFEVIAIIVSSLIVFISWAFLKYADIPVTVYTKNTDEFMSSSKSLTATDLVNQQVLLKQKKSSIILI